MNSLDFNVLRIILITLAWKFLCHGLLVCQVDFLNFFRHFLASFSFVLNHL